MSVHMSGGDSIEEIISRAMNITLHDGNFKNLKDARDFLKLRIDSYVRMRLYE